VAQSPAVVASPINSRRHIERPSDVPRVHIGSIEVTIVSPPPPAPLVPAPVFHDLEPASHGERLSRSLASFGLGQG
jgi:hypothetical protein